MNIKLPRLHPDTWAKDLLCEKFITEADKSKIIIIMYSVWDSRNKWTHGEVGYKPQVAMEFIRDNLLSLEMSPVQKTHVPRSSDCRWEPPMTGTIKINSDGALSAEEGVAGDGGVARDNAQFLGAWCKIYPGLADPLTIEALALRDVVAFTMARNFNRVVFEVDCVELVRLWKEGRRDRSVISPI
jgi:hypothetical protein